MSKQTAEQYRVVKKFSGFFNHWYYTLEKKETHRFLFRTYTDWGKIAGTQLTTSKPTIWNEFNIVDEITQQP